MLKHTLQGTSPEPIRAMYFFITINIIGPISKFIRPFGIEESILWQLFHGLVTIILPPPPNLPFLRKRSLEVKMDSDNSTLHAFEMQLAFDDAGNHYIIFLPIFRPENVFRDGSVLRSRTHFILF